MARDHNLEVALRCAEAGLHVFPCHPSSRPDPSSKTPTIRKWRDNSTTNIGTIESWWRFRRGHLVAIDLHKAGLLVVDGDCHPDKETGEIVHDGVEALRNLFREHGCNVENNPVVRTPSDGVHVYFKCPPGFGNTEGDLPDGINIRGSGGYVIAPDCIMVDGGRYEPVKGRPDLATSFRSIPELPGWFAEIIRPPSRAIPIPVVTPQKGKRFQGYAAKALDAMARRLGAMAPETGRNIALNNMAFEMGTMVNRGWIDRASVEQVLFAACHANALIRDTGSAVRKTLASALNAGVLIPHRDLKDR
jgi:hypothetical protein